jgi:protein ImuB
MKRIVFIWLPHWPIERLQRQSPGAVPPDQPFALVEKGAHGLAITAVNANAKAAGVRVGLSLADARACLPTLLSRTAEPDLDAAALIKLARWSGCYSPSCNRDDVDGLWIDATGAAHLFGGEEPMLAGIVARLKRFGITAQVAMAETYGAAHAFARFAVPAYGWLVSPPASDRNRLGTCPVEALRLTPAATLLLKRLGLKRIGQLYDVPRISLERRFATAYAAKKGVRPGSKNAAAESAGAVLTRLDQALGLVHEPLQPLKPAPLLSARQSWSEPLISSEALEAELLDLAESLCASLQAQDLGARRIGLVLYRADGSVIDVEAGLSSASADAHHVMHLLHEKLGRIDCGFGIDVASLEARTAERLACVQVSLDQGSARQAERGTAILIDRLTGRFGTVRVYSLAMRARHIPECAQMRVAASAACHATQSKAYKNRDADGRALHLRAPLLMSPPEPITVMAEVPEGIPRQFVWRRVHHRVVKGEGPERILPEWWRWLPASPGVAVDQSRHLRNRARDYYRLEDKAGATFWVFREGLYEPPEPPLDQDCVDQDRLIADATSTPPPAPRWFVHGLMA